MLHAVRISNFAVIEEVEVGFGAGLTVLTGETGAGKSILVDALGLLLGGRADPDAVRAGCDEAAIEGVFEKTPVLAARLGELGLPDLGPEVGVRRVIAREGRTKAYVNGAMVTVGVLARLMKGLVDIAGQHEHVGLFDPASHRELLDREGQLLEKVERYRQAYRALVDVDRRIELLGGDEQKGRERLEFLRFQLEELTRLDPKSGEDVRLEEEKRRLMSSEKLRRAASEAEGLLSGNESATLEWLGKAEALLLDASRLDPALTKVAQSVQGARVEVEEASRELSRYLASLDGDPEKLGEVDERLDALKRLCRKHGTTLDGVIARTAELAAERERLENRDVHLAALLSERTEKDRAAKERALELTAARKKAAVDFVKTVRSGLAQLALAKAEFEVRFTAANSLGPDGADEIEFFFSANPGEPVRPLAKVASGGEASRLLLALKGALAVSDVGGSYVFDEADSGVGGAVADVVGRLIKDVSEHRQVLCITHLPQVAAYADSHLVIEKLQQKGRTRSTVTALEKGEARTRELARMLSGVEVTREALGAAEALVRTAHRAVRTGGPARGRGGASRESERLRKSA